jgi:hypothetical protein
LLSQPVLSEAEGKYDTIRVFWNLTGIIGWFRQVRQPSPKTHYAEVLRGQYCYAQAGSKRIKTTLTLE